ncbi:tol-pal system protein YbgF [Candidatus Sarmatiella mevalonica]|uniref:tol-pal system protein YbgF n=1 Tax=Candidatus Sarmatiella mevalonica TaxID=2770581 RepID=UPI0019229F37|nr:tol-pal system protein YbgF [Candidatus Sarmatiella mevalonica]
MSECKRRMKAQNAQAYMELEDPGIGARPQLASEVEFRKSSASTATRQWQSQGHCIGGECFVRVVARTFLLALVALTFLCSMNAHASLRSKSINFDDGKDKSNEINDLKDQITDLTNKVEILEHLVNQLLKTGAHPLPPEQLQDAGIVSRSARNSRQDADGYEEAQRMNKSAKDLWESQRNKLQGEVSDARQEDRRQVNAREDLAQERSRGQRAEQGRAQGQGQGQEQGQDKVQRDAQTLEDAYERQQRAAAQRSEAPQSHQQAPAEGGGAKDRGGRPSAEKVEYDEALAALKENKLQEAERRFQSFINKYPKSNLQSNAYFWYAESFFKRNAFEKAAVYYLKGYKMFPKGGKAADSLLKLASCLSSLNKKSEACAILKKLDLEFPNRPAPSVKRAQDLKAKLGCD